MITRLQKPALLKTLILGAAALLPATDITATSRCPGSDSLVIYADYRLLDPVRRGHTAGDPDHAFSPAARREDAV